MDRQVRHLLGAVLFFLFVAATSTLRLDSLRLNYDEVWSVWSTLGTYPQSLSWIAYDWPPLYPSFMWLWQTFIGIHPLILRFSSVLIALLAYALAYRAGLSLFQNKNAAWAAAIVYAALGYSQFLTGYVRAYMLMQALFPLAIYLMLRYFHKSTLWNALLLALTMAALFYTNLTAVVVFAAIGILSLALHGKQIWKWWLPAIFALLLAIPEISAKLALLQRREANNPLDVGLVEGFVVLYKTFFGLVPEIWAIGLVLACLVLLWKERLRKPVTLALALCLTVLPVAVYFLEDVLGFFEPRYSWWMLLTLALFFAAAIRYLPAYAQLGLLGAALVLMLFPAPDADYISYSFAFEDNFHALAQEMQADDVLLVDPLCNCGTPMEWDYYQRVYFPQGLALVRDASIHRRVWYVSRNWEQDALTHESLLAGRIPTKFIGPAEFFMQLYQAPPLAEGILFENGMRFLGAEVVTTPQYPLQSPIVRHEGTSLHLRLWWSVDTPPPADYSVSVQLVGQKGLVVQNDSAPQLVQLNPVVNETLPPETSRWQVGQFYIEERELVIPNPTSSGDYMLYLIVYQWWDGLRLSADGVNADTMLPLMPIYVMSW